MVYAASPIKRQRRTKADIARIREAMVALLREDNPMTVRQVFYRLVGLGIIDKSEAEYNSTVCRLLTEMRLAGTIPFGWIADNTRWVRRPTTFDGLEDALYHTARFYRRRARGRDPAI